MPKSRTTGQRKLKVKIHFNRVAMQRKQSTVWTAKTSRACHGAEEIIVMSGSKIVLRTVFDPQATQPRAYLTGQGTVRMTKGGKVAIVEV